MALYGMISPRPVTELSYRYNEPKEAHIYCAFEISNGKPEIQQIVRAINARPNMEAIDITENELAKSHLRFLAGGRAPTKGQLNEKLYRFSFPERPGALKIFLELLQKANHLGSGGGAANDGSAHTDGTAHACWNLTLVHYRCSGEFIRARIVGWLGRDVDSLIDPY